MNGRVLPFEGRGHRNVALLLPWYANGTLEADDQARVLAHLPECATCRQDLLALEALIETASDANDTDPATTERDWQRLRARLQAVRRAPADRLPTLQERWSRTRHAWRGAAPWLRVAVGAQAAMVLVLGTLLFQLERAPAPVEYRTLSATPVQVANADRVLVVFDPRMTDAQTRALLTQLHARIVDGPNDAGAYLLTTPAGQAESVRDRLRASPGVAMAELLSPPKATSR